MKPKASPIGAVCFCVEVSQNITTLNKKRELGCALAIQACCLCDKALISVCYGLRAQGCLVLGTRSPWSARGELITGQAKRKTRGRKILILLFYHPHIKTMTGQLNCGVWISVSVLLYGSAAFTFNSSTQNQPLNVTSIENKEITDWDSAFLQLRANLPSHSQPIRPYTLLTNAEDYHYMPKPRHCRPARLLRLLGSCFGCP